MHETGWRRMGWVRFAIMFLYDLKHISRVRFLARFVSTEFLSPLDVLGIYLNILFKKRRGA